MSKQNQANALEATIKEDAWKMLWVTAVGLILIFIATFTAFYFVESSFVKVRSNNIKGAEKTIVDLENDYLGEELSSVLGDLFYLHDAFAEELSAGKNFEKVSRKWMIFSGSRGMYDQIRFIDAGGDEKIRINYANGRAYVVIDKLLQNKADRYYFYESASLKKDHIFVSRLDLNMENSEIEIPIKPMIRFSMAVHDGNGRFKGVIVLNYLANNLLENFNRLGVNSDGDIILLDEDSYWLVGDSNNTPWNFMYRQRREQNFAANHPAVWEQFDGKKGQVYTPEAFYTWARVDLYSKVTKYNNFYQDKIHFSAGDWYIVSQVEKNDENSALFLRGFWQITTYVLTKRTPVFLFILILSAMLAVGVHNRHRHFLKIKYYSEFDPLTNAYNRRAGIDKLNELIPLEERREHDISVCFIDVNGLKLVNDNLGHEYGDELIISVVAGIKAVIRSSDILIRLGGDEFLIVFAGINEEISERVWQRIKAKYDEINENEDRPYEISVSHGIVSHKYMRQTLIDDIIKQADEKMYEEKQEIKKHVRILREPDSVLRELG